LLIAIASEWVIDIIGIRSNELAPEVVILEAVGDGTHRVWFGAVLLGLLDKLKGYSQTASKEASSWPPL